MVHRPVGAADDGKIGTGTEVSTALPDKAGNYTGRKLGYPFARMLSLPVKSPETVALAS